MSLIPVSIFSGITDNHRSVPDQVNSPDNDRQKPHFQKSIDPRIVWRFRVIQDFDGGADLVIALTEKAYLIHRPGERLPRGSLYHGYAVVS